MFCKFFYHSLQLISAVLFSFKFRSTYFPIILCNVLSRIVVTNESLHFSQYILSIHLDKFIQHIHSHPFIFIYIPLHPISIKSNCICIRLHPLTSVYIRSHSFAFLRISSKFTPIHRIHKISCMWSICALHHTFGQSCLLKS